MLIKYLEEKPNKNKIKVWLCIISKLFEKNVNEFNKPLIGGPFWNYVQTVDGPLLLQYLS